MIYDSRYLIRHIIMDNKNIAILTWLHNGNYGTVLQAFALQRYLRNVGYNVHNIDFFPSVLEKTRNLIVQHNPISLFWEKLDAFLMKRKCPDNHALSRRFEKFNKFLVDNLNLTKRYSKFSGLEELSPQYDCFICGSDQIWSPTYFSPPFFFDFVANDKTKIGYSCSFGISSMPIQKAEITKKMLQRFQYISVREESGRTIINNLLGLDVAVNVDPTLLLSRQDWNKITAERIVEQKYMFCYFLTYNAHYWRKAQKVALEKKLQLVFVPATKRCFSQNGISIIDAGPYEWLSLIRYADLVFTDSFHCCIFSIIFHRNFAVFKRFDDGGKYSRNTRVYNLLETYELGNSLVKDVDDFYVVERSDEFYDRVDSLVMQNSRESKKWLENAIEAK